MAAPKEEDMEVRREDQERINEFGRNTNHLLEMKTDRNEIQKELDYLEDAEQEILLSDESDEQQVRFGDCFLSVGEDDFNDFIETRRETLTSKYDSKTEDISVLESRQDELKKDLYARFGSNINLDL